MRQDTKDSLGCIGMGVFSGSFWGLLGLLGLRCGHPWLAGICWLLTAALALGILALTHAMVQVRREARTDAEAE